jgi:hypothetical protein
MDEEIKPYLNLWQSVLLQMILDLTKKFPQKGHWRSVTAKQKLDVISYLKKERDELETICDLAGMDFDYFLEKAKRLI